MNHRTHVKGSPYCYGKKVSADNNLVVKNPALAKQWHPTKNDLTPYDVTSGSGLKVARALSHCRKRNFYEILSQLVDFQEVRKLREGIEYILNYLLKTQYTNQSKTLTLALCWLFKKRSFTVSGEFHEAIYALINIQFRFVQTDLFGNTLRIEWVFIGIFTASKLGIDRNEWRKLSRARLRDL
jgi:hypothetical protein